MSTPVLFALEPLHRARISRAELVTAAVDSQTGRFIPPVGPQAFAGVDLHEWAARFFRDFDRLLAHPALRFHLRGKRGIGGVKPRLLSPVVAHLFSVRDLLATAIAEDLHPLSEPAADGRGAAQAAQNLGEARGRVSALGRHSLGSAFQVRLVEMIPGEAGTGLPRWREFPLAEREASEAFDRIAEGLPLTVRSLPDAPSLLGQGADAVKADEREANPLRSAGLWRYSLDCGLPVAAQDELCLCFSSQQAGAMDASSSEPDLARAMSAPDLFAALACYVVAAPGLEPLLAPAAGGLSIELFAQAVNTFADLATDVANCWTRREFEGAVEGGGFAYRCRFRFDLAPSGRRRLLGVDIVQGDASPRLGWPVLKVTGGGDLERVREVAGEGGMAAHYRVAEGGGVESTGTLAVSFVWPEIDLMATRRLRAAAYVERNGCLPVPEGARVADRFVLRSPEFTFAGPLVPSAVHDERIALAVAGPAEALERIFTDVLRLPTDATDAVSPPLWVRVEVSYHFSLTPAETLATTVLPVLLLPMAPAWRELIPALRRATEDWLSLNNPSRAGAFWQIGCEVFDAEDGRGGPWLRLGNLWVPIPAEAGAPERA